MAQVQPIFFESPCNCKQYNFTADQVSFVTDPTWYIARITVVQEARGLLYRSLVLYQYSMYKNIQ